MIRTNKIYNVFALVLFIAINSFAQKNKPTQEALELQAKRYVAEGNEYLVNDKNFPAAEGEYRKAIAKNPIYEPAKYNLGNAYFVTGKYDEALQRYNQAIKVTDHKQVKHLAHHNRGNTFMRQKKYDEAVEAYKNALRNNPMDNETRYNLALAKKMKEQQDKEDQNNKDQNKDDKKDQKDGEDKKDQKDKEGERDDKGKEEEGKDPKDDKKDGEDKKDQKDKEGNPEKDQKEGNDKKDKEGKGDTPEEKQQQPVPGQLSPQQVKSLLEAMSNQEKKVQEKMNAQKVKGANVHTEKDW